MKFFLIEIISLISISDQKQLSYGCNINTYTNSRAGDTSGQGQVIGVDIVHKKSEINGKYIVNFNFWDMSGQLSFKEFRTVYYKGAQAAILVFNVTKPKTLQSIYTWKQEIEKYCEEKIPMVLVGNKIDFEQERKITSDERKELARELGAVYFETSAKMNVNIKETVEYLAKILIQGKIDSLKGQD